MRFQEGDLLPLGVLAAAGAALVIWACVAWKRSRLSFAQFILYALDLAIARIWWGARVTGRLPTRRGHGAVIVCNHISSVDPFLLQLASESRVIHWMVAKEYFAAPLIGDVLRLAESIPVGRGGIDTAATKLAIRYVQQGGVTGLFPEGKINISDDLLLPGRVGAALIALKTRAPVFPCFLAGVPYTGSVLSPFLSPARVRVIIGPPMDLSPYFGREKEEGVLEEITKLFLVRIAALAGQPDYEPQVIGRRRNLPLADEGDLASERFQGNGVSG